jgi:hypothetical protein
MLAHVMKLIYHDIDIYDDLLARERYPQPPTILLAISDYSDNQKLVLLLSVRISIFRIMNIAVKCKNRLVPRYFKWVD